MPDRPALHPRLRDPAATTELAAGWRAEPRLRIDDLLEPGLAAELAVVLRGLPFTAIGSDRAIYWQVTVELPDEPDPQHPGCLFRLADLQARELPALLTAITNARWIHPAPRQITARSYRMGSFADATDEPRAVIGLTGARWPSSFGGHTDRPPGWDCLDLAATTPAVSLITRPVESLEIVLPLERD